MTDLPNGWEYKTLGEVAKWGSGGTPRAGTLSYYDGEIPWAIIGDLNDSYVSQTARNITKKGLEESSAKMVPVGAVLIAMYGSIGKLGINTIPMATNQAIAFAIPKIDLVLQKYLFYYLRSQREVFLWSGKGATQQNISQTLLKAWKIPLPPIPEQQEIVEILEDHLTRLDAALADVKQAKVKAARFRHSLLLSLVSPAPVENEDGWMQTTLGRVCDLVAGKTPSALEGSTEGIDVHSRTIPFYKVGDMNLDPEFLCKSRLYLSERQIEERKMFVLPIGTVVFPKAGGAIATNKKRIVSVPGPIDLNCMAAIPIKETIPKYLYWWFQSINLETFADGSILPQLSKGRMSEIPVYWPNPQIQEEILLRLEQALSKNSQAIQLAEIIEANAISLRRSLLQAAFTGRLTKEVASV